MCNQKCNCSANSKGKVIYFVDEVKGIVVAKLFDTSQDANRDIATTLVRSGIFMTDDKFNKSEINNSFTGKAKCSPEDTFDVEFGKKLAKSRLLDKYHNAKAKAVKRFVKINDVAGILGSK